jgi:hypothetical protein
MIEYRFKVSSAAVFTLYSYSKALEYRFRVPTTGSLSVRALRRCRWSWQIRPLPLRDVLRLPALMDLYIHPLYILVSKILSSILNSSAPIHPLYHPLSTLSTVGPTCHFI